VRSRVAVQGKAREEIPGSTALTDWSCGKILARSAGIFVMLGGSKVFPCYPLLLIPLPFPPCICPQSAPILQLPYLKVEHAVQDETTSIEDS
jgi:hypothetical protein